MADDDCGDNKTPMAQTRLPLIALLFAISIHGAAHAQELVELSLRIPMPEAGVNGLEAVMVRPNDSAAHPLALLNHGSPRDAEQRPAMTAWGLLPQAREFARRGWTAVIVLRRGFGTSGGGFSENARGCSAHPDYYGAGKESVKDLRAAITYLSSFAAVDASRIISVGISAGGFATVALAADPPPGLVAAISFAGGRGSDKPDEVCNAGELIGAFAEFGGKSRLPMLWVYAQNDHFFRPRLAEEFYQAFVKRGGTVSFIRAAAFGKDGHTLFSYAGIPIWTPLVDDFLAANHLKLRDTLLALPVPPDVSPPARLSAGGREVFRYFLTLPPKKAFAVSPSGHYGYAFGRRTENEAAKSAGEHCNDNIPGAERCEVVFSDGGAAF